MSDATWDDMEARCLASYRGGYNAPGEEEKLDAFRRGVQTAFNVVKARAVTLYDYARFSDPRRCPDCKRDRPKDMFCLHAPDGRTFSESADLEDCHDICALCYQAMLQTELGILRLRVGRARDLLAELK